MDSVLISIVTGIFFVITAAVGSHIGRLQIK